MRCSDIQCCCGRDDCASLQHNAAALEGLEKDVETAAGLGQALLNRHESYMTEAEADRTKMRAEIDALERRKQEVAAENARIVEENRSLVDQMEDMNQAISESDAYVKSLTTTLESTQLEIRRLTVAASRAAQLESELLEMETQQVFLQDKLSSSEENAKSAVQRWKKAETTITDLQDQLDRMEKESKEESEKHRELVRQTELKRVESPLGSTTGRLGSAVPASSQNGQKNGTKVVSHFVRDILQDNANLQMSIVELREMLQNSDQEVQNLREQIFLHQPLERGPDATPKGRPLLPLSEELEGDSPTPVSQELHVHHHYYGGSPSPQGKRDRSQPQIPRRHKKRRPVFPPTLLESPSRESAATRRTPSHAPRGSTSSVSTIFSQASLSSPNPGYNNSASSATPGHILSSSPTSPQSTYQSSSIFDRVDRGFESSRPTTPESSGVSSPVRQSRHMSKPSESSFYTAPQAEDRTNMTPVPLSVEDVSPMESKTASPERSQPHKIPETSPERLTTPSRPIDFASLHQTNSANTHGGLETPKANQLSTSMPAGPEPSAPLTSPQRPAKPTTSHKRLTSFPAMDIHTSIPNAGGYRESHIYSSLQPPSRLSSAGTIFSSVTPVISRTNATVPKITVNSGGSNDKTSVSLLSSVASANPKPQNGPAAPTSDASSITGPSTILSTKPLSITKRMGSRILNRWGRGPSTSSRYAQSTVSSDGGDLSSLQASETVTAPTTLAKSAPTMSRPPGVNQKGPIQWLPPPPEAPTSIQPTQLDEELLQESLQE